ncbi:hypothetical protein CLIB1423_02S05006 [[Candida] railenensis]|uniref:Uncharacterized protein n=1 Tax=[Candida] railenensis TaxID=45579 RepID=A0A9P0QKF6_9ASCO|nr:hypothetical protein CLIB1423_02S05006 [[Candida] railenensis]
MLFSNEKIERDLNLLMNNLQPPLGMEREESIDLFQNLAISTEDLLKEVQKDAPLEKEKEKEKEVKEENNPFLEPETSSCPARVGSKSRKSITPLRIRENINHFFGVKQDGDELQPEPPVIIPNSVSNESLNFDYIEVPDSDFPIGRYAIIEPNQRVAFMQQIEKIKSQNEYFFYYKWVLWIQNKGESSVNAAGEALSAEKIIETNLDLKVASKFYKKKLKEEDGTLIFMKMGMLPNKKSPKLIGSSTITFQVPDQFSYEMLKETVHIVLNDELTTPYNLDCEYYD